MPSRSAASTSTRQSRACCSEAERPCADPELRARVACSGGGRHEKKRERISRRRLVVSEEREREKTHLLRSASARCPPGTGVYAPPPTPSGLEPAPPRLPDSTSVPHEGRTLNRTARRKTKLAARATYFLRVRCTGKSIRRAVLQPEGARSELRERPTRPTHWTKGGNQLWNANVSERSPRKSTPSLYLKKRR